MTALKDVLSHLMPCYKSMDIAALAINDGTGKFINIATQITFSKDECNISQNPISENRPPLRIIKCQLPVSEYPRVQKEITTNGILTINNTAVDYFYNHNIDQFNGRFETHIHHYYKWPIFVCDYNYNYLTDPNNPRITNKIADLIATLDTEQKQPVLRFGYGSLSKLIKDEIRIDNFSKSPHLNIILPVYSKIEEGKIHLTADGKKLIIPLNYHKDVKPLLLLGEYIGGPYRGSVISDFRLRPPEKDNLISEIELEQEVVLDDIKECNMPLDLKHIGIGESIHVIYNHSIRDLILKSDIYPSPLYSAFSLFVSSDKFAKSIDIPETLELSNKKTPAEHMLEETIYMLLSAGGMPTICLGKYETLCAPNSDREIGSADLLSYYPEKGMLFVISCKTRIPARSTILSDIINTARKVSEHLNNKTYKVKPMLITNSAAGPLKKDGEENDVIVWDKDDLTKVINTVKLRPLNIDDFRPIVSKLKHIKDWHS